MALARAEEVKEVEDVVVSTKNGIFRTFSSRTLLKKNVAMWLG